MAVSKLPLPKDIKYSDPAYGRRENIIYSARYNNVINFLDEIGYDTYWDDWAHAVRCSGGPEEVLIVESALFLYRYSYDAKINAGIDWEVCKEVFRWHLRRGQFTDQGHAIRAMLDVRKFTVATTRNLCEYIEDLYLMESYGALP